jgi:aminopeptidase YwaD
MGKSSFSRKAERYLRQLCEQIGERSVGSAGNQHAAQWIAEVLTGFGFTVARQAFDCIDWSHQGADMRVGEEAFEVQPSPYSLGCDVRALMVAAESLEALRQLDARGKVLLLHGELAAEPLMPKNFPFYNPEEHRAVVAVLETLGPAAIVAATSRHPSMAGALYPFPLIEDGDFDIASVFTRDEEGRRLGAHVGRQVTLVSRAQRRASTGCNILGRRGESRAHRIVVTAHLDAKRGTPGATDNAGGIAVLLLLAEHLAAYRGRLSVEIAALNGEDYYSSPGEQLYLAQDAGSLAGVELAINLDGAGYHHGDSAFSVYECPPPLAERVRHVFSPFPSLVEGEPWYQGDHMLFVMNGRPAVAITSAQAGEMLREVTHTARDRPDLVDAGILAGLAEALHALIKDLEPQPV